MGAETVNNQQIKIIQEIVNCAYEIQKKNKNVLLKVVALDVLWKKNLGDKKYLFELYEKNMSIVDKEVCNIFAFCQEAVKILMKKNETEKNNTGKSSVFLQTVNHVNTHINYQQIKNNKIIKCDFVKMKESVEELFVDSVRLEELGNSVYFKNKVAMLDMTLYEKMSKKYVVPSKSRQKITNAVNEIKDFAISIRRVPYRYINTEKIIQHNIDVLNTGDISSTEFLKILNEKAQYVALHAAEVADASKDKISSVKDLFNVVDSKVDDLPEVVKQLIDVTVFDDEDMKSLKNLYKLFDKLVNIDSVDDVFGVVEYVCTLYNLYDEKTKKLNFNTVKLKAILKVFQLVLDKDGYILKNDEKYKNEAYESIAEGNIIEALYYVGPSAFVQTVGKGSADVIGRLLSDIIHKAPIAGDVVEWLDAFTEDFTGKSVSKFFNDIGTKISDGVDCVVDNTGKIIGKAEKKGKEIIHVSIKKIRNFFKKLF